MSKHILEQSEFEYEAPVTKVENLYLEGAVLVDSKKNGIYPVFEDDDDFNF